MARSRYSGTPTIDGRFYSSFALRPNPAGLKTVDLLAGVKTQEYVYKVGDRLDHLAAKHFGDEGYWWVIALVNNIVYPFASGGLIPGKVLLIPESVQDVLEKILR